MGPEDGNGYVTQKEFDTWVVPALEKLDLKLDKVLDALPAKANQADFDKHCEDVWDAINAIRRWVYIAIGIGTALEVVVLPALMVIMAVVIR